MDRIYQLFSFSDKEPLIFTQLDFWLFFIVVMMVFSFIHNRKIERSIFLTVVSLFFYFKTSGLYVLLLCVSLLVNYLIGIGIHQANSDGKKKGYITLSVLFNLLTLAYFKYAYFFTDSFNAMFGTKYEMINYLAHWANGVAGQGTFVEKIILPVGVSFFTFQSISYVVDIYRKEIEPVRNFFDYSFFVTFFPQLVAGPIVRARDFIPQIYADHKLTKTEFSEAVFQIVKGLFKKIILADYIAVQFIDKVMDAPESYPGFVGVIAMWGYSLQIYGDFAGYTDIAIGLSKLMGFNLLENFNSPYKAVSVADFWRRWHKSLGSWLRDYLYIPLGGNKTGGIGTFIATFLIFIFLVFITRWYELLYVYAGLTALYLIMYALFPSFKSLFHRDLNLLITMVVGGLWHGASANFVIWGAMNGTALILYNHWKKISPYENSSLLIVHIWRIFLTFNFITFTRIWFRLQDEDAPIAFLNHVVHHFDFQWETFVLVLKTYQATFWIILTGFVLHWLPQTLKEGSVQLFGKMPMVLQAVVVAVSIVGMYQAVSDSFKAFVYFQF